MTVKTLVLTGLVVALLAQVVLAADPPLKDEEMWVEATEAPAETVKLLLERHRKAVAAKDAAPLRDVLTEMLPYNNERFRDPVLKALAYKAGTADKKAVFAIVKERRITKMKRIKKMISDREQTVQVLAARMLANYPGKATNKLLHRMLVSKAAVDDKPLLAGNIMITMGRLGYTKAWKDIQGEFRKFKDGQVMRGAVLYFGLTKEKRVARMLCDQIDEPAPANVNSPTNPPASYWEALNKKWQNIKDVVPWALKEITGYEGEFHSGKQARDYIKDHGRRLGIR